jgi:cytidyltransferase-like protein
VNDPNPAGAAISGSASRVVIGASFDNLRSPQVRFVQEAARCGAVHVRVPNDALVALEAGGPPNFPLAERRFLAGSLRGVGSVGVARRPLSGVVADVAASFGTLVVSETQDDPGLRSAASSRGLDYRVIRRADLAGFPPFADEGGSTDPRAKRVVVTGCFDWLHSGHVRFFMDAAGLGELYVVVGSDRNVELLKGPGHPLQRQDERRYMVQAVTSVKRALISSGNGWMDAEPEIDAIAPHCYVVNEDGDVPEKREFCRAHGLEYVVLKRRPHGRLPRRSSTDLRGF